MSVDMEAVRRMARESADKEGTISDWDREMFIGTSRVRVDIPLRDTVMLAKHLEVLAGTVERCRAILSYKVKDERGSLLAVRGLLRQAQLKINAYKRVRRD